MSERSTWWLVVGAEGDGLRVHNHPRPAGKAAPGLTVVEVTEVERLEMALADLDGMRVALGAIVRAAIEDGVGEQVATALGAAQVVARQTMGARSAPVKAPIMEAVAALLRERGWIDDDPRARIGGTVLYGWSHPDIPGRRYPMPEAVTAQLLLEISEETFGV